MGRLAGKRCVACEGGLPRLAGRELAALKRELDRRWRVVRARKLAREFEFQDFAGALRFTNEVGGIAEKEWHHPEIELGWGRVAISIHTHAVGGLTRNDFILAAKIDRLVKQRKRPRRPRRAAK